MARHGGNKSIKAIKVHQWDPMWEDVEFEVNERRRRPDEYFLMFAMNASELRALCGISRRDVSKSTPRRQDIAVQRKHDADRSKEIARYIKFGYPWSVLSEAKREQQEFNDLRKPGWLPTAIVLNILPEKAIRGEKKLKPGEHIEVIENGDICELMLPYRDNENWNPSDLPPFEVIDGQHRLFAFDYVGNAADFQLPVIAFKNLDISWQAYLFWTINIKPVRINPSLAFDLYPLLRSEDWLERGDSHVIYRDTRSQEIVEALWSHPQSPWQNKINMLGDKGERWVSQNAWIRNLTATFVRPWYENKIGGLFGTKMRTDGDVLSWTRAQQAALLIFAWDSFAEAIRKSKDPWAENLRANEQSDFLDQNTDAAFYGRYSLIATDQGVRGFLHVLNDVLFANSDKLQLEKWSGGLSNPATDIDAVTDAIKTLKRHPLSKLIKELCGYLSAFDWRTSATPNLPEDLRRQKAGFRGSGGYKEIRLQLLEHLESKGMLSNYNLDLR